MTFPRIFVLIFLVATVAQIGCRSRKRSQKVNSQSVRVIITLKNIDEVLKSKIADLQPEISCNEDKWTPGVIVDDTGPDVEFFVSNLKVGDLCSVRLLNPSPPTDMVFIQEEQVMYGTSNNVEIGTRVGGQLWAEALLARFYKGSVTGRTVNLPVTFGDGIPADANVLQAQLTCRPEFEGTAIGVSDIDRAANKGNFVFDNGVSANTSYQCDSILVLRGKDPSFFGEINQTLPGSEQTVNLKAVELTEIEITYASGITIKTAVGDACADNEIFDVETRRCQPRP